MADGARGHGAVAPLRPRRPDPVRLRTLPLGHPGPPRDEGGAALPRHDAACPGGPMNGPRLGGNMSITGGKPEAGAPATAVEAGALQGFGNTFNQLAAAPSASGELAAFRTASR